jgi:CheY-like chemotaxis protein
MTAKKRVLVVDDDHVVRAVITKVAEKHGAVVTSAADGAEARKVVDKLGDFDVVFLDLLMPHVSGWDVLESIKANPASADVPIIIVSGAPVSEDEKARLGEKVAGFVDKETFTLAAFEEMVSQLLAAK